MPGLIGNYALISLDGVNPNLLAGPDEARYAILFGGGAATYFVAPTRAAAAASQGIRIVNTGGTPIEICRDKYGDLVGKEWWGFAAVAVVVGVLESRSP